MNFFELYPLETAAELTAKHDVLVELVKTYLPTKYTQEEFEAWIRLLIKTHYDFASFFVNAETVKQAENLLEESERVKP